MELFIWIGIGFCLSQSAMFSGLNLAFFSISRLRLEIEASNGNQSAVKVLKLREDSNFLLTTILWGNVGINVLLTLLSNSVLAGLAAFLFSTILITFFGEIIPQAYFSRNALRMAALLSPILRLYQFLLYLVAKPSALLLDSWLGVEDVQYFKERSLKQLIRKHIGDSKEIDHVEGMGAINFLSFDDVLLSAEGVLIDPESVLVLPESNGRPTFPSIQSTSSDPFLQTLQKSNRKWVIVLNQDGNPISVIDADGFLREAIFEPHDFDPYAYIHKPLVIHDERVTLGQVLELLKVAPSASGDIIIPHDIVLLWGTSHRIITGADLFGRLLKDIAVVSSE